MKHRTSVNTTLITTGTVLTSLPVFAHSGHVEKTETKTEEKSLNSKPDQSTSVEKTETKTEEKSLNSKPNQSPSNETQTDSHEEQSAHQTQQTDSHEEQPTTQNQTLTIAKIPTVGETLLGLIIVAPFLLYALKKRIHRYR
ncbi:MAG: hypothetical protein ABEI32_03645 [Halothece sp.]